MVVLEGAAVSYERGTHVSLGRDRVYDSGGRGSGDFGCQVWGSATHPLSWCDPSSLGSMLTAAVDLCNISLLL